MISILTPSRSRPVLAQRMLTSALRNPGGEIEIKFFLNNDDPLLDEYFKFLNPGQYIVGPNQSTSYSWNIMAQQAKYDILFLVGDDAQFPDIPWVPMILQAFENYPDKIACVYPRAPSVKKSKNPHFCLHKNWVNCLGFFVPPQFYHWYVDTWIREVAQKINRFHLIPNFEMPIESISDSVTSNYHNSWMKLKDEYVWSVTSRYRDKDAETLSNFIKNFKK